MGVADRIGHLPPGKIAHAMRHMVSRLRGLFRGSDYRPERYYMRGPGPKARAKDDGASSESR
jgi:hypothetical protein